MKLIIDEIIDTVNEVLEDSGKDSVELSEDSRLVSSGLLSSMEMFSVILLLESRGYIVADDFVDHFDKIKDIAQYLSK